jgi:hypothetical protein
MWRKKFLSSVYSTGLGSFSTSNDIFIQLLSYWWSVPHNPYSVVRAMTNVLVNRLPYILVLLFWSWFMNHGPVHLQRHDKSRSPWAVCRVFSSRSCLCAAQIVAIKSCPSMLCAHPEFRMPSPSTVVQSNRFRPDGPFRVQIASCAWCPLPSIAEVHFYKAINSGAEFRQRVHGLAAVAGEFFWPRDAPNAWPAGTWGARLTRMRHAFTFSTYSPMTWMIASASV